MEGKESHITNKRATAAARSEIHPSRRDCHTLERTFFESTIKCDPPYMLPSPAPSASPLKLRSLAETARKQRNIGQSLSVSGGEVFELLLASDHFVPNPPSDGPDS